MITFIYRLGLLCAVLCHLFLSVSAQSARPLPPMPRANRDSLPYKLNPGLPAFNILLRDSVEIFNTFYIPTGRPIALMLFSPDCKHCKDAMHLLTKGMDSLADVRFYLVSLSSNMPEIRKFYEEHQLGKYSNIEVVGCDYEFFYLTWFGVMHVPDLALYDADKKFVHLFESTVTVRDLYEKVHSKK